MTAPRRRQALAETLARLKAGGIPDPGRDARLLLAEAVGTPPDRLMLEPDALLGPDAAARLAGMIAARLARQPVAQILGRRQFWGRDFRVSRDVLDPRPETECLVALALEGVPAQHVLDLGTGSGAILLTLLAEWPAARGLGIDASPAALAVAGANAAALGLAARAELRVGDWLVGVDGPFDLVVCNPPYIAADELPGLAPEVIGWEPLGALSPGADGLAAYARIAPCLAAVLAPGGRALFEIGPSQGAAVAALFGAAGFAEVRVHPDLDLRDRVIDVRAER